MKVEFKFSRSIDGKVFNEGVHEVSDSFKGHWFFDGLVKTGDIVILEESAPVVTVVPKEEIHVDVKEFKKKSKKD
jgi:hypothetical protein